MSDLWESALTRGGLHMDEQEACYYLRQFVSAMDYLHRHKVAHRCVLVAVVAMFWSFFHSCVHFDAQQTHSVD